MIEETKPITKRKTYGIFTVAESGFDQERPYNERLSSAYYYSIYQYFL